MPEVLEMKVRVSLVQFARERLEKERNFERMVGLLKGMEQSDVVCLPENWVGAVVLEEGETESMISTLREIASEKKFNLLTGGAYVRRGNEVFDSCFAIDREGKVLGICDKIFPSKPIGEREFLSKGKTPSVFELDGLKVGVAICVDAVYPEVSRSLASKGAEMIFNPSNIPEDRLEMWRHIGVARAIENGVFFAFLNNTSTRYANGRKVSGHSFVVSPGGEMIFEADEREQVISRELDLGRIAEVRSRWPFLADARERRLGSD